MREETRIDWTPFLRKTYPPVMLITRFALASAVMAATPFADAESPTDAGAFSKIEAALASDPARAAELEFVNSARPRLLQQVDRGLSTDELLFRFDRDFSSAKPHPLTQLVVLSLIANRGPAITWEETRRFEKLAKDLTFESPESAALLLRERIRFADNCGISSASPAKLRARLTELLGKDMQAPWFKESPALADRILSAFEETPVSKTDKGAAPGERSEFAILLESIPQEKRSAGMYRCLGKMYTKEAWRERGRAFAEKTSAKQFEGFRRNLAIAAGHLKHAHELDPRSSETCRALMTIAMADPREAGASPWSWLRRAMKATPEDTKLYTQFTYANLPRWNGDPALTVRLYEELRTSKDYDSLIPATAPDLLNGLWRDYDENTKRKLRRKVALDYLDIANAYVRREKETGRPLIDRNGVPIDFHARALAYLAREGHLDEGGNLEPQTHRVSVQDTLAHVKRTEAREFPYLAALASHEAKDEVTLRKGYPRMGVEITDRGKPDAEEDVAENPVALLEKQDAECLKNHGDPAWLAAYRQSLAGMSAKVKSPAARGFLDDLLVLNQAESDFVAYKPVDIPLRANLWTCWLGNWSFGKDGAKAAQYYRPAREHRAEFLGMFNPPYELRVRIKNNLHRTMKVGLSVGRNMRGQHGCAFVAEHATGRFYASAPGTPSVRESAIAQETNPSKTEFTLKVRVFAHGYSLAMNDSPFFGKADADFVPGMIALGNLPRYSGFGYFVYSDLKIRRLKPEELSPEEKSRMQAPSATRPAEAPSATDVESKGSDED